MVSARLWPQWLRSSGRPARAGRRTIGRVVAFDVFLEDCPARTTLDLVADTWSLITIVALGDGPMRYSELRDRIGGISKKMLTSTLHKLQANGLVAKRALATAPPGTQYRLTALGQTLLEPVTALTAWAQTHTGELLDARERISAAAGPA